MDCPTCGDSFDSEHGMRIHHGRKHGEKLPNRTCKGCESEFYDPKSRLKYCDDCNPNEGENNGNWKGAKEKTVCRICEKELEYYPSNKDGLYCTNCIESTNGLLPQNPATRNRVEESCTNCGTEMKILPSRASSRKRGVFCNLDCYGEWLSQTVGGEDHHQWEGGTLDYGQKWWQIRSEALERDGYTCQKCGKTEKEIGRKPDVHHIDRVRDFDCPQKAHTLDNVITLGRSCHRNVEAGTIELPAHSGEK